MNKLMCAAALAIMLAAPAAAQQTPGTANPQSPQPGGSVVRNPNDVIINGRKPIGRDPDPFIRNEMRRHYDSGWPD